MIHSVINLLIEVSLKLRNIVDKTDRMKIMGMNFIFSIKFQDNIIHFNNWQRNKFTHFYTQNSIKKFCSDT